MFEEYTYENILARMLDAVSGEVDKREGSVIYDALAPAAVELQLMYIELENMLNECFADTADRTYLIRRAAERGLQPYGASGAVLRGIFDPEDAEVEGKRFNLDSLNYVVGEALEDGGRAVYCESVGSEGNLHFGSVTPLEYIAGLRSAYLTELITEGTDEEDTESFRERYLESLQTQAFGGNIADYRKKLKALNEKSEVLSMGGVGQVRVYTADEWNGGGTVKVVFATRANAAASAEFIDYVQNYVDPVDTSGKGMGFAPVGHRVSVTTVRERAVPVSLVLRVNEGYTAEGLLPEIRNILQNSFADLNESWEELYDGSDNDGIVIVVSYIAGLIQTITGVRGISNINIDGAVFGDEKQLGRNEIAVLGELSVEVSE